MKARIVWAACVAVFVYALVFGAPVAAVYGWLAPQGAPARLVGVDGTLRHGSAAGLLVDNRLLASRIHWTLNPWSLLAGRIGGRVKSEEGIIAEGKVALGFDGLSARDLRATGNLKALLAASGQGFVPVDGQFGLALERARLSGGLPKQIEGRLTISGLIWVLGAKPVRLGDFQADVAPADGDLVATVSTLSGPTQVTGNATLRADGAYLVDLRIKAQADADPLIENLLRGLGNADAEGYHRLRDSGRLGPPPTADQ